MGRSLFRTEAEACSVETLRVSRREEDVMKALGAWERQTRSEATLADGESQNPEESKRKGRNRPLLASEQGRESKLIVHVSVSRKTS